MQWAWQRAEWPNFSWQPRALARAEEVFLVEAGLFMGKISHLDPAESEQLTVDALSTEAVTTAEIEGEILDRASVQSSIRRQFGLSLDHRRVKPAEQGIAEMMVDLHRSFAEPLSHRMLFSWHRMLVAGRRDLQDVGRYRTHMDPMQIVSGPLQAPHVYFEAPPSAQVPREMSRFIAWLNHTAPSGPSPLPALTRAAIAHFYFICIHPFEDGNGRIGRAIAEKVLAQSLGRPTLMALASTILNRRKAYYDALERNNTKIELTDWLSWFAAMVIEAQRRTIAMVEFVVEKTRLLDRLSGQLNDRQLKALLRMLREGPDGFTGGLSGANYRAITGATTATATRDLAEMVVKGALSRVGERRYARYHLAIALRPVARVSIDRQGHITGPG